MSELQRQLDARSWSVPEGWTAERFAVCGRCHDTVLWCLIGHATRLKFDRDGADHFGTCTNAPRQGVGRKWRGQHNGQRGWETK